MKKISSTNTIELKNNRKQIQITEHAKKQNHKLNSLLKNIIYIIYTASLYLTLLIFFLQYIRTAEGSDIENPSIVCSRYCGKWSYEKIMTEVIFPKRGFLCRILSLDCFDECISTDPIKSAIMNEWNNKKTVGNFFPYLKQFNQEAFEYFCSNVQEISSKNPQNTPCPSTLRFCSIRITSNILDLEAIKNCKNWNELPIILPDFKAFKNTRF